MAYGKLIGAKMYEAPNVLNKDGKQYINPSDELYLEYGYLPLEYTTIPDTKEGYHLVQSWVNVGDRLIQAWNYEADEEVVYLMRRLQDLEERIEELTFSLKRVSTSSTEERGSYSNPICYIIGDAIEAGLWYTDGINIKEAKYDGIPIGIDDSRYF